MISVSRKVANKVVPVFTKMKRARHDKLVVVVTPDYVECAGHDYTVRYVCQNEGEGAASITLNELKAGAASFASVGVELNSVHQCGDATPFPASADFLGWLGEASKCCADEAIRYGTDHILLGDEIAGTDGRCLLVVQRKLPFRALIKGTSLFTASVFRKKPVMVTAANGWVTFYTDEWVISAKNRVDEYRYPDYRMVMGRPTDNARFTPADLASISKVLHGLPNHGDNDGVLLEGDGTISFVGYDENYKGARLACSTSAGTFPTISMNRRFAMRAAAMGLDQWALPANRTSPITAHRDDITFIWMPLSPDNQSPKVTVERVIATQTPTGSTSKPQGVSPLAV